MVGSKIFGIFGIFGSGARGAVRAVDQTGSIMSTFVHLQGRHGVSSQKIAYLGI